MQQDAMSIQNASPLIKQKIELNSIDISEHMMSLYCHPNILTFSPIRADCSELN